MRKASQNVISAINSAACQCADAICKEVECVVDGFAVVSRLYAWLEIVLEREGGDTGVIRNEFFKSVEIQRRQIEDSNKE